MPIRKRLLQYSTWMLPRTSELRRVMGVANQLGKFSLCLAEITQPLRELHEVIVDLGTSTRIGFLEAQGRIISADCTDPIQPAGGMQDFG